MMKLANEVYRFIRERGLIGRGDRVLVAVSGGPDSVALLKLLCIFRKNLKLELFAAHYNHGLRGKASDADEVRVRELATEWGVSLTVGRAPKASGAASEEMLRNRRYAFLTQTAKKLRAAKIATAHTADDQAETVLMRILRGTGLRGPTAIPTRREQKGVLIVRPLLGVSKKSVLKLLSDESIRFQKDATNQTVDFMRNRVRMRLIPGIERNFNPQFKANLVNLAEDAEGVYALLNFMAQAHYRKLAKKSRGGVSFARRSLKALPEPLRKELYFVAIENLLGNRRRLDRQNLESVDHLLDANGEKKELKLPRGIRVSADSKTLAFR